MCGRGRAVGGLRYLNFVRAACEVGPTRYAGAVAFSVASRAAPRASASLLVPMGIGYTLLRGTTLLCHHVIVGILQYDSHASVDPPISSAFRDIITNGHRCINHRLCRLFPHH